TTSAGLRMSRDYSARRPPHAGHVHCSIPLQPTLECVMKNQKLDVALMSLLVGVVVSAGAPAAADQARTPSRDEVGQLLKSWPAGPQLAGQEMMAKYGPPQEVTPERLIWRSAGPFKRITVTRDQLPHDFPAPHEDYLEHTINYKVPLDKVDQVLAFDA